MFLAVTSFYLLCLEFVGLPESLLENLLSYQILFISQFLKSIFLRSYYLTHQAFFTLSFVVVVQLLSCVWLLQSHGLQHTRLPWPSLSPRICSNSWPLSQWCYPTISSSVALASSYPQSFPAWRSFPVSHLFPSGSQDFGASASVLPVNIQGWLPLELTGLIPSLSKGLSRVFSSTTIQKHQFFGTQPSLWSNYNISTWLLEKP